MYEYTAKKLPWDLGFLNEAARIRANTSGEVNVGLDRKMSERVESYATKVTMVHFLAPLHALLRHLGQERFQAFYFDLHFAIE